MCTPFVEQTILIHGLSATIAFHEYFHTVAPTCKFTL